MKKKREREREREGQRETEINLLCHLLMRSLGRALTADGTCNLTIAGQRCNQLNSLARATQRKL